MCTIIIDIFLSRDSNAFILRLLEMIFHPEISLYLLIISYPEIFFVSRDSCLSQDNCLSRDNSISRDTFISRDNILSRDKSVSRDNFIS